LSNVYFELDCFKWVEEREESVKELVFKYVILFGDDSASKISAFANQKVSSHSEGRDLIQLGLGSKKKIKTLFREVPGKPSVFVRSTAKSDSNHCHDINVLPLAKIEAMGVDELSDDQVHYFESHGAIVLKNDLVSAMTSVRSQNLMHSAVHKSHIWHVDHVLKGRPREGYGKGVRVGIVDTGLDASHPEFKGTRTVLARFRGHRTDVVPFPHFDKFGHGTSVASIICGRNLGLSPGVEIAVCDVFENRKARILDVLHGINWLCDNPFGDGRPVDVINMSLGLVGYNSVFEEIIATAVEKEGIIFVAAVGNDSHTSGPTTSPACYTDVISVGALNRAGNQASFSNVGQAQIGGPEQPDIWAPGVEIYCATQGGKYDSLDGTSFAAPVVSAIVARAIAKNRAAKQPKGDIRSVVFGGAVSAPCLPGNPLSVLCVV